MALKKKGTNDLYAVKKMKKSYIVDTNFVKYIKNERKMMEDITSHPFLIGLEFVRLIQHFK